MVSPARQQYLDLKREHPDAILLYRLGDFYEMFDRDAEIASKVLGIQLTARSYPRGEGRVPMAGVPHHSVDSYIKRLLEAGYRVAMCEQLTEAGKGLVERGVVRVFTSGTIVEPTMLRPGENNYLAAVQAGKNGFGLAFVDVTTGEFAATEFAGPAAIADLEAELLRISPAECLMPQDEIQVELPSRTAREIERDPVSPKSAADSVRRHFQVASLAPYGLDNLAVATTAVAAILHYLKHTNSAVLDLIQSVRTYSSERYMVLDRFTRSSLELLPRAGDSSRHWSLLRVLDRTKTGMGSRRLRLTIGQPLLDIDEINSRLDAVAALSAEPLVVRRLGDALGGIGDIERIMGRLAQGKSIPSDLTQLKLSLQESAIIRTVLETQVPTLDLAARLDGCDDVCEMIEGAIDAEGGARIKPGHSTELDELRSLISGVRDAMAAVEKREIEATGIKSLKVGYNKVFGYYLEVGKAAVERVPERFIRQQTLLNSERYYTPEIKELETKILGAKESADELERTLFHELVGRVISERARIMATAASLAELDLYRSLADVALANNYVRPVMDDSCDLHIVQGRHPVVELANVDDPFVPNDIIFDDEQRLIVLMGPNMGGKSTTLRTAALIVLMAQIGSFVPANEARLGIVDRIFSRVGAQDDISAGQSTFMTEMIETSNILHHATLKSLLILDEIGRGTSTYDGLAIARAVIEYLQVRIGARTLFATHYHELAALEAELDHVKNFHTAIAEQDRKIIFLHRVVPGAADRSYGIHVARLAGLPHSVTVRAERILRHLERSANGSKPAFGPQLTLFTDPDLAPKTEAEAVAIRILDRLLAMDLSSTTPLEALERLHAFQEEGRSSE